MTASEYQRSIYRGDPGRLAATFGGPAARPQPGGASVGHATEEPERQVTTTQGGPAEQQQCSSTPASHVAREPEEPEGAAPVCSEHVYLSQESEAVPEGSGSQNKAATAEQAGTPAKAASCAAADGAAAGEVPQKAIPKAAAPSKEDAHRQAPLEGSSSAAQPPAAPAQRLDMPPLPRPEVRHVQMGKAEVDDVLKVILGLHLDHVAGAYPCSKLLMGHMGAPRTRPCSMSVRSPPGTESVLPARRAPCRRRCCWISAPAGVAPAA